jgi:hypothetical protein
VDGTADVYRDAASAAFFIRACKESALMQHASDW